MRTDDITQAERMPPDIRTDAMYLPPKVPVEYLPMAEVKKGLDSCGKCGGSIAVCRECKQGCPFGRRAIELTDHPQADKPVEAIAPKRDTPAVQDAHPKPAPQAVRLLGIKRGQQLRSASIDQTIACARMMRDGLTLEEASQKAGYKRTQNLRLNLKKYAKEVAEAMDAPAKQEEPVMIEMDKTALQAARKPRAVRLTMVSGDNAMFALDAQEGVLVTLHDDLLMDGSKPIRPDRLRALAREIVDAVDWFEEDGRETGTGL